MLLQWNDSARWPYRTDIYAVRFQCDDMKNKDQSPDDLLERMLSRSDALCEKLLSLLDDAEWHGSPRGEAACGMCFVALEHGTALRALIAFGLPTSAVSLMRLQFEALTRAIWLIYASSDQEIATILAPLTTESEKAARSLPSVSKMIDQIGKQVGQGALVAAHQMLVQFKDVSWQAMNSFVHGGIHPLRRSVEGFPVQLALQILRNTNALVTMTGMVLANLTADKFIAKAIAGMQQEFADCLPDLIKQ